MKSIPHGPNTSDAYKFFHEGTIAMSKMEAKGLRIDTDYLDKAIIKTGDEIHALKQEFYNHKLWRRWQKRFGHKAKIGSVKQLGGLLSDFGFKALEKTDIGNDKWDERAIDLCCSKLPILKTFIRIKKLEKALGTYLKGIRRETKNGYLHPSFNLAGGLEDEQKGGAMSYRGSSSNPNLHNMPIRNKETGKLIRSAVIAPDDYFLAELDHSTIEVRVAGAVTGDSVLIDYVKHSPPKDMHRDRAMELFYLAADQVVKKGTRDASKNKFVFPQFYGSYYIDCALAIWEAMERSDYRVGKLVDGQVVDSDVTIKEHLKKHGIKERGPCDEEQKPKKGTFEYHVKEVEENMWNNVFKEYTEWKKRSYEKYLRTGIVEMPTGFVARGAYRKNQVLNLPIQGPAFHILLWGIIHLQKELERLKMRSYIVGHIHDCMLAYIHKKEVQQFLTLAKEVMTKWIRKAWKWIIVPLEIEVDIVPKGLTWNDKQPYVEDKNGLWIPKA